MNERDFQEINALLASPKNIAIIPHRSPDGDAMGSTLGLYHFLKKLGQKPVVIAPNEFPDFLAWLPSSETVKIFEKDKEAVSEILEKADIVFTLDFNALHRTGEMEHTLARLKATFIMIDHHQKPDDYATYTFSNTSYGSTCEMVYDFILGLGKADLLDKTIATCIYCGIMTDSGSFRFPSTTSKTHRIVADLIDLGVENGYIHNSVYDSNTYNSLQLLGRALQNLKIIPNKKTSYTSLSAQELEDFRYVKGDTEGIVNYGLSLKGIVMTAIFIEHKDENIIKISFRSKGDVDVNQFAREHFNGGGHINAAGGKSLTSLQETIHKFEGLISQISI
ncbi:bifunctional oligoribonuclease/PAP phosphatase NrnA [Flavobacterium sp. MAH-1]|uniref:Bifunctional oligoribonuclease/PAP phosphatase NrnA n=1 Tax=Flavobacterium agri TaxID=2743471 RepID=A0A7Y8Y4M5_9FLAO|nr:bifunctional oligoribonuclease/PAP phosphatase NrnA [Flavobacterium agri]NUY82438.1 bifunctional oligoribonuclease/PAP phosphatase NrnA [Flavobacterium agri]NYA72462.1 bifunctional oligoribonuclease/PAP phosphatase NrnA [Flavobacterium agri]